MQPAPSRVASATWSAGDRPADGKDAMGDAIEWDANRGLVGSLLDAIGRTPLVLTPGAGTDIDLALEKLREILASDPAAYFFPGEFENPDNPAAQASSGDEIWEQAGGRLDAVVASQGTGGWITGAARSLKGH